MNDIGRAEALLKILDPAPSGGGAGDPPLSGAFLAETMELRERIEEADADQEARDVLRREIEERRAVCIADLGAALDALEHASPGGEGSRSGYTSGQASRGALTGEDVTSGQAARGALARLRYVERMLARLREQPEA